MKRLLFLTVLMIGAAVTGSQAQQPPPPPPPPPPPTVDQTKPRQKPLMTNEQRALAEQRLDARWSRMNLESKTQLMRLHRALAEMPPEERKFIHDRIERFLSMTPAERQRAREEFRSRQQEFEQQWHHNHPGEEAPANPPPPTENNGTPAPPPPPPATP